VAIVKDRLVIDLLWRHYYYGNISLEIGWLDIWYNREMANNNIRDFLKYQVCEYEVW